MADIVITEFMDETWVGYISSKTETVYDPSLAEDEKKLQHLITDARVLIVRNKTQVTNALITSATKLEVVGRLGVGLDNIDQDACKSANVKVIPANGANDLSVAEYVISTAMILLRNAYGVTDMVLQGSWPRQTSVGHEISGKTLGLVGFGSIAQLTARMARSLGMDIIFYDPFVESSQNETVSAAKVSTLEELASNSDVVSIHVPLTSETQGLIGDTFFASMRKTAILINAARGGVVNEDKLASHLRKNSIAGAALDVFETEPLSKSSGEKFSGIENLVLTPHIAGVTRDSNYRVSELIAKATLEEIGL